MNPLPIKKRKTNTLKNVKVEKLKKEKGRSVIFENKGRLEDFSDSDQIRVFFRFYFSIIPADLKKRYTFEKTSMGYYKAILPKVEILNLARRREITKIVVS